MTTTMTIAVRRKREVDDLTATGAREDERDADDDDDAVVGDDLGEDVAVTATVAAASFAARRERGRHL